MCWLSTFFSVHPAIWKSGLWLHATSVHTRPKYENNRLAAPHKAMSPNPQMAPGRS